ncbi:MAG: hypothetical protein HOQ24_11680 [Mycobacteriaceae bacterium]|nr:hypothetical protein [Mycobacteriaceae bacterium]
MADTTRTLITGLVELVVAVTCAVAAWSACRGAASAAWFPAVDDLPAFRSTHYSGGLIFGAALLGIVGFAAAADGARRLLARQS